MYINVESFTGISEGVGEDRFVQGGFSPYNDQ